MISRIGEVVNGKYKLIRLLGDGGMGAVYEAQHEVLGTRVAIKVLHSELARRAGLGERFLQEARVAAQIRSPHVVQVMDVDRTPDGLAFIVMEILEGEPLSTILDRQSRLPVTTSIDYTVQILEALEAAHSLGVIHRDLKPENVFVTYLGGRPVLKLIDFGIAKLRSSDPVKKNLTIAGALMGTAEYMAPEQARSAAEVDARSDIYAVGVMLYEMIAGTRPVLGDDARVIALKVERGEVIPLVQVVPDVPRELAGLVHRAMAAQVALRFASATEMRLALQNVLAGKRGGTGQLAATPQQAAPSAELAADGTGTMKGAPANEVLAAAMARRAAEGQGGHAGTGMMAAQSPYDEPKVDTMRVPPAFGNGPSPQGPSPYGQPPQQQAPAQHYASAPAASYIGAAPPNAPRRKGFPMWLLAVPVAIGLIALVIVLATSKSGPTSWTPTASTTSGASTGASTSPTAPSPGGSTAQNPLKPLDPANPHAVTPGGGGGVPALPSTLPSGLPSSLPSSLPSAIAAVDAAAPVPTTPGITFGFPDAGQFTIPPLPSGFPTTIPSTFPFQIPTALPTASH